jgi:hypothetical protein
VITFSPDVTEIVIGLLCLISIFEVNVIDRNVNNDFILTDSVVTLSDISKDVINGDFGNNWKIDSQTSTAFEYTQDGIEEPFLADSSVHQT